MGDRQPFRFRLPWFSTATPPRPTEPSIRPPATSQPTTAGATAPAQRPPFRPAGIARPPTQAPQARPVAPRQAPPPTPAPPAAPETQAKPQAAPFPLSPPRATTTQTGAPSVPQSPSNKTKSPTSSKPPLPPGKPIPQAQPISPPKKPEPPINDEQLQRSLPGSAQLQLSASRKEGQKPVAPEQLPQEARSKVEITKETIDVTAAETTKNIKYVGERTFNSAPKSPEKTKGIGEQKKDAEKLMVQEKKKDEDNEDLKQRTIRPLAAALESVKETRELLERKIHSIKRKQDKQESPEMKRESATTSSDDEIKTMTSTHKPKDRRMPGNPHRKPGGEASGESSSLHKGIKEDVNNVVHKLSAALPNESVGEKPISVITVAGENRGASMHIGSSESGRKERPIHIHRGYKSNPDESPNAATTDGEGRSKGKMSGTEPPVEAYVNSNIQSINNSIAFDSCVNERNPGVHMVFHITPEGPTEAGSTKPQSVETRKSETSMTPAERLTHEPRVRRRCLRGLFLEPSDEDVDDPQKPRRHGCKLSCGEKGKDKDVGIF